MDNKISEIFEEFVMKLGTLEEKKEEKERVLMCIEIKAGFLMAINTLYRENGTLFAIQLAQNIEEMRLLKNPNDHFIKVNKDVLKEV